MSYAILALLVLIIAIMFGLVLRRWLKGKPLVVTLMGMLLLTAIFDNLIIFAGIVGYDEQKISGIKLGLAPIEDFSYTIVAVILVPTLFNLFSKKFSK